MTDTLPATLPAPVTRAQQHNIVNIIRRAAKTEILPRFRNLSASEIDTKSSADDLVTAADKAAEAMITRALRIAFPHALIIGEEAVAEDASLLNKIADAPVAFIIDPVDGTWNFAHGVAIFGVMLAVTQYGRPAFGIIYDPIADDWAIADEESAPRMETASGTSRPLKAADDKPIEELTGFVPLHMFPEDKKKQLALTMTHFKRIFAVGCSAHDYRMMAQGHVDFMLSGSLNPWDHAAGTLICERAGSHVEMLDGDPYTAGMQSGTLLVAPDRLTWNRLQKMFNFLLT